MSDTIESVVSSMHKAVDALAAAKQQAGNAGIITPELQAMLDAQGLTVKKAKVPAAVAGQASDAIEVLKLGIMALRVSDRNERPDDEKATFINLTEGDDDATLIRNARADMIARLEGVDSSKYKLFEYNPKTGRMKASAYDPNKNMFVGIGEKSQGYNTPGSLAWKIKTIIAGKDVKEVTVAS